MYVCLCMVCVWLGRASVCVCVSGGVCNGGGVYLRICIGAWEHPYVSVHEYVCLLRAGSCGVCARICGYGFMSGSVCVVYTATNRCHRSICAFAHMYVVVGVLGVVYVRLCVGLCVCVFVCECFLFVSFVSACVCVLVCVCVSMCV
eukprot:GHVQ01016590.1.p2 GENE.GHVQ01016590.1~~GHVQ01016590.1.p2  ORF type:complete len:146 (-),score=24.14 GHVQ01016590.1:206-643(-)